MRIHPSSQRSLRVSFFFPFLGILGQSRSAKGRTLAVFVDPLENIDRIYPLERKY